MKKFLRTLLLIVAIVPCAILFAACGIEKYDRAKSEASFKSAVDKLENLGGNYTAETTKTASGMFAEAGATDVDADSIIKKFDNGKTSCRCYINHFTAIWKELYLKTEPF